MRVLIVGGGIGGLCLAQGLQNSGIDVQVFEKQQTASENLAGYGIHIDKHGRKALQSCLAPAEWKRFQELSTSAGTQMFFRDQDLRLLAERDDATISGKSREDIERRGIGRLELRDILLTGLNTESRTIVHWGKEFDNYEKLSSGGIRVHFADGSSEEGDILIGADSGHSKVRKQLLPTINRVDLGIVTIAGRYLLTEERMKVLPSSLTDGSLNNVVPKGKGWMFVSAWHSRPSAAGTKAEHYVVWAYVIPRAETPADAKHMTPTELRRIALQGIKGWSKDLETLVQGVDLNTLACVPLKSAPYLDAWEASNVTLMGDAIHSMTPMAGSGANTALRDAETLTAALREVSQGHQKSISGAIGGYESKMRAYANSAVGLSRRNAESASAGQAFPRFAFRTLLKVAQRYPTVMNMTIGKAVVAE